MKGQHNCRRTFPVTGMSCAACAARVEKALSHEQGVSRAAVNFAAAEVTVEYDSDVCTPRALREAVRNAGYDLVEGDPEHAAAEAEKARTAHLHRLYRRTAWAAALSLLLVAAELLLPHRAAGYASWLLATPVVFILGRGFFAGAWRQLSHRTANMDTLVTCSTGIAYAFSLFNLLFPQFWTERGVEPHLYFESSAVIITFILLGRSMEERAKRNASSAISRLMGLRPKTVCRIGADGTQQEITVDRIETGDRLLIRPGERVAADGTVIHGTSYVDESMLNGEPLPASKAAGDTLYAGTVNGNGALTMPADALAATPAHANRTHGTRRPGQQAPRAAHGRPHSRRLRAGHYGHGPRRIRRMARFRPHGGTFARHTGAGDGAHHSLPLRAGARHAHSHNRSHRARPPSAASSSATPRASSGRAPSTPSSSTRPAP